MVSKHKLDVFETLKAIDRKDHMWLADRSEEERKGFAPSVVLRWMSAVSQTGWDEFHLLMVNERVNSQFFDLGDHPDLQFGLLAACGSGSSMRHQWIPLAGRKQKSDKFLKFVESHADGANADEINTIIRGFSRESFAEFVLSTGCDDKELKDLLNGYDRYTAAKEEDEGRRTKV